MKPKYKRVCPYCGETCEGYVGNSLICKCGAKYYYTTQTWLERKKPKEKNTPDVVEVVRCKDCKFNVANMEIDKNDGTDYSGKDIVCSYFMTDGMEENDYCSRGEMREE